MALATVRIEYDTTLEDVDAWHRQFLKLLRIAAGLRHQSVYAAFVTGVLVMVITLASSGDLRLALVIGGLLFVVTWALFASSTRPVTLSRARRATATDLTSPALGHHILEISADAVTETCEHQKLSVRWDAVEDVTRTNAYLFILLRNLSAIIVPLSSFSSDSERDAFIDLVRSFSQHIMHSLRTAPFNKSLQPTAGSCTKLS
jgi:YcxB-like protein